MSFNKEELEKYCDEIILKRAAIDRQIVVLCEGFNENLKKLLKGSVPTIGDNFAELYQDASFYQRSIPKWCRDKNIVFYIFGRQKDVLKSYFYLKKKYQEKNDNRLDINKIFALVDIDIQKHSLPINEIYSFQSLEAIYNDLYINGQVNQETAKNHKIWVTGLLHKEAYFLIPEAELKKLFEKYFNDNSDNVHKKIAKSISTNKKIYAFINKNFDHIKNRIKHHSSLYELKSIDDFQNTWLEIFSRLEITDEEKRALIYSLLTIANSKSIWEEITSPDTKISHKNYRDKLSFEIALKFYR